MNTWKEHALRSSRQSMSSQNDTKRLKRSGYVLLMPFKYRVGFAGSEA